MYTTVHPWSVESAKPSCRFSAQNLELCAGALEHLEQPGQKTTVDEDRHHGMT
jgi:hypothetical protein